ncbi:MAG: hypothetical protein AB1486_29350 [Planctomycetota bacterium]
MRSLGVAFFLISISASQASSQCLVGERQCLLPERQQFSPYEYFGWSLDIDGDTAVAGAPNMAPAGGVIVFERRSGIWAASAILTASDGQPDDAFGESLAIDNDVIAIGAPERGYRHPGAVYVFRRGDSGWLQEAVLEPLEVLDRESRCF